MVFWNRLRQSKLINIILRKQFNGSSYIHTNSLNHKHSSFPIPTFAASPSPSPSAHFHVRFFAAPVQVKKKQENQPKGPNLNEKITAPVIRLVLDEDGTDHEVVSLREALDRAKRLDLDLVEVDRKSDPPVCKLMDYNKERYKQQIKVKERAKSIKANLKKGTVKEIRFTAQITSNDIRMKADAARRVLEEGYRVKCQVTRKKKEDDLGKCLSQFLSLVEDITHVDFGPIVEADQAHCVFRHIKLGTPKRTANKASKVASPSSAESTQLGEDFAESESGIEDVDGSESDTNDISQMATLPANRYSQPTSRGPSVDSAGRPASPLGTENRYQRDQRNINAPVRPVGNNYTRIEPPPTEQGRQSQFNLASPHDRAPQRPGFGNPNIPGQNSRGSSYGNFGAPQSASSDEQQNTPGQTNRYKKVSAGDRIRNRTSHGAFDNGNSAAANPKYSGGTNDTGAQGKVGAFSSK